VAKDRLRAAPATHSGPSTAGSAVPPGARPTRNAADRATRPETDGAEGR